MKGCDCPATLLVKNWRNKQCTNGILLNNCWETNCLSRFSSSEFLTFCKALREMREEARRLIFCAKVTWSGYKSSHWRLSWLVKCIFNSKWSHCLLGRRYRDLSVLENNSSAVWIVPWLWGVLSGRIKQTLCFYSYLQFKSTFHTRWRRGSQWEIFHSIVNRLRSDGCSVSKRVCLLPGSQPDSFSPRKHQAELHGADRGNALCAHAVWDPAAVWMAQPDGRAQSHCE